MIGDSIMEIRESEVSFNLDKFIDALRAELNAHAATVEPGYKPYTAPEKDIVPVIVDGLTWRCTFRNVITGHHGRGVIGAILQQATHGNHLEDSEGTYRYVLVNRVSLDERFFVPQQRVVTLQEDVSQHDSDPRTTQELMSLLFEKYGASPILSAAAYAEG